ncbi:hypothetical protein KAR91_65805 [Candidatus Pacearchaeota archaeon]|nr:hypothetical protein [Candidatus Pacearchaeota archaeon]
MTILLFDNHEVLIEENDEGNLEITPRDVDTEAFSSLEELALHCVLSTMVAREAKIGVLAMSILSPKITYRPNRWQDMADEAISSNLSNAATILEILQGK